MTTASRTAPATRVRHDPAVLLWGVAGACWAGTLALVLAAGIGHGHGSVDDAVPWPAQVALSLAAWTVMVGAMMLPTLVPLARLFTAVTARTPRPWPARAGLYAGYLGAWVAVAPVALAAGWGLHLLVGASPWLAARDGLVLGGALLLAGGFQFSRLKDACLTTCRSPASFLWRSYRRGFRGGGRLGVRAGLWCLGCCWALMLLMVATGAGSLAWMLALTAVMVAEKTARWGARLVRPVGIALLLCGVAVSSSALFAPAAGAPCHHGACAAPPVESMLGPPVG
jgi:predicted metal-binding membrane protein